MFVDASAMVAMIERETEALQLALAIEASDAPITSPIAIWETTISLARAIKRPFADAERLVAELLTTLHFRTVPITPEIGTLAIKASRRFGRGRHRRGSTSAIVSPTLAPRRIASRCCSRATTFRRPTSNRPDALPHPACMF